ncbi:MAG: TetR/AcrR family transcriptional regulator C-terminal domain-containing protein [Rhodocyclaceae bacterium]
MKPRFTKPSRAPLSRERVIQAALELADAGGTDRLTMRALAAELGVEAMSLYNHVRNKEDLLDGLVEAVVAKIDLPRAEGDWQGEMQRRANAMRSVFLAHPWAPPLIVGRINTGPHMLSLIEATLSCLRAAGFSTVQADHVMNALDSYLYGFHLLERSFPLEPERYAEAARAFLPSIDADRYPHFAELAQVVADGRHDGVNHMAFGLDRLLRALEQERHGQG